MSSSSNLLKTKIIKLTNDLLLSCNNQNSNNVSITPRSIKSIDELNSNLFIYLFENICNIELENKRTPVKTIEDEVHNIQTLIDVLAEEILHEDLSHLNGESIFNGDLASIEYLLDILRCINEWISSRLESMNSNKTATTTTSQNESVNNENQMEYENNTNTSDDTASFDNEIWQQHLEYLNEFEQLSQDLELNYLSGSDVSSVNTSAFSYRPTKKVVTFNSEQKSVQKPTTQIGKKLSNLYMEDKENKPKQNFVKLNNCPPPTNLTSKSYIIGSNEKKIAKPKPQLNPVQRFQEYKKQWEKQKAPGEKNHAELRWWIRSKMSEKPVITQKPLSEIKRQEWVD